MRTFDPKKILIIDEDTPSTKSMSQTLLRNGYRVLHATDERRAITVTKRDKPDLIICNTDSKQLNINQLMKSIQSIKTAREATFLLITNSYESLNKEPGLPGAAHFLNKPYTREQHTTAVQKDVERIQPLLKK